MRSLERYVEVSLTRELLCEPVRLPSPLSNRVAQKHDDVLHVGGHRSRETKTREEMWSVDGDSQEQGRQRAESDPGSMLSRTAV